MTKLSVNINKIATIRNARGGNNPDVVKVALDCERYGAEGITVHPRPDERHIRYADVIELKRSNTYGSSSSLYGIWSGIIIALIPALVADLSPFGESSNAIVLLALRFIFSNAFK